MFYYVVLLSLFYGFAADRDGMQFARCMFPEWSPLKRRTFCRADWKVVHVLICDFQMGNGVKWDCAEVVSENETW